MSKPSNRRCRYFDKNGDTIGGGCKRSASLCGFYHPEEEGWDVVGPSISSRSRGTRPSNKQRRSPSPYGPGFRRDSGYSRHRRSRSRSRSHSRSPRPSARRDSNASSIPELAGSPRNSKTSHDPRTSTLIDVSPIITNKGLQLPQSSTSSATTIPKPMSPKTQPQASSSTATANLGDLPASSNRPPITIPWEPKAMRPAPPTLPPPPLPMLPPRQPLPTVPPALSAGMAPSTTVEQTPEEKRAMWERRTRILSESELAREQLTALEEQLVWSLQIIGSRYFVNETEEEQTRLKKQLSELEKQRDEVKKLHEESVDKLFKTGSWPVGPPTAFEDGVEERHKEVVTYIQELKDTALQMSKILGDISTLRAPPPPPPPLFLSDDSDGTPMDVDQPDNDNTLRKSLKRRRISENMDGRSEPSIPTREELNGFLERLAHMEGLVSTLQNDINEHGREAREEFEQLVDTKLEEFQVAREEAERQRLEEEKRQMQALEQDITVTGEQVGELASEIGDLIVRVSKLEVGVGASKKGREESMEKVLEVERRLQEYISSRDANVRIIQTLEMALNAYISQPPSPPATPLNLPPFDYIFQSLEEPMIQTVRSHLVHVVEELRKDVENMVRTQNAELYSTLWNKITVTLKVLDMIQSRINQGDTEPVQRMAENITMNP